MFSAFFYVHKLPYSNKNIQKVIKDDNKLQNV